MINGAPAQPMSDEMTAQSEPPGSEHGVPARVNPRLAIYQSVNVHSPGVLTSRRYAECLARVTELGGVFDPQDDRYTDNVSLARRSATGFHLELGRLLVAVAAGRYDGVVMWQLPWHFTSVETRAEFQRVMVESACDLYLVLAPALSLFGPAGLLFAL